MTETFARIPHDRALTVYQHLGGPAWVILIELDRLVMRSRGKNPVKLTSARLTKIGITDHTRRRGLRQLEEAGIIAIKNPGPGQSLLIHHLWFPVSAGDPDLG